MSTHVQPAPSFVRERLQGTERPIVERARVVAEPRLRKLPAPVRFADATQRQKTIRDAERSRAIVLMPVCAEPGGLAEAIDADLESVLASRGAMPPSVSPHVVYGSVIDDQIARAAALPVRGLCLCVPRLSVLVENGDELHDHDARTLASWMEAARAESRLRLVVLFHSEDQHVRLNVPTRLDALVGGPREPRVSVESREVRAFDLSPLPPAAEVAAEVELELATSEQELSVSIAIESTSEVASSQLRSVEREVVAAADESAAVAVAPIAETLRPAAPEGFDAASLPELELPAQSLPNLELAEQDVDAAAEDAIADGASDDLEAADVAELIAAQDADDAEQTAPVKDEAVADASVEAAPSAREEAAAPAAAVVVLDPISSGACEAPGPQQFPARVREAAHKSFEQRAAEIEAKRAAEAEAKRVAQEAERVEAERAARLVHAATWRAVGLELDAARGPKPVSVVEKLYATKYVPLLGAIQRGEVDRTTAEIWGEWRKSFSESYEAAWSALRVTGKRPTMVMDAPDVAMKVGRLASARSMKLVMIDSMSFDLGERVATRVSGALEKRAALVERTVLWSALPSMTSVQMHLLAKGTDGLKDVPGPTSEPDITRGRNVSALRREKLGSRELLKLDLVEARLRAQGAGYDERLDALADEVADVIVKLMETLPPRTLVYVFGDHGFTLEPGTNGWATAAARQGGSSPEEVLVSGHGWLVDAVQ